MKICCLAGGGGWHVQDLQRAAAVRGDQVVYCPWRQLVGAVREGDPVARCEQLVLDQADAVLLRTMPPGSLEQIIFRMDLMHRLHEGGQVVLNRPRAIEIAVDKYLALARLRGAGLPVPPTVVCQRLSDAVEAFGQLGGDVVVKPIFGSEGFGIMRASDPQLAERAFALLERTGSVLYIQQFVPHDGSDYRLFVLGGRVLAAMRRVGRSWRTNIACGGQGEPFTPDGDMADMAVRAAAACDADIAGVDVLVGLDGRRYVIEVNAVPGLGELSRVTGVDVADRVLGFVRERICAEKNGAGARGHDDDIER